MSGRTGRFLVDASMRVNELDEAGVRTALSYLIGASARSIAVRRAIESALDAAATTPRPVVLDSHGNMTGPGRFDVEIDPQP